MKYFISTLFSILICICAPLASAQDAQLIQARELLFAGQYDEAIEKANNTPYGLSAGVWTDKGSKAFNMSSQLKAGVVWANTYNKFDPTSPFGGYKESGYGREGGIHGLSAYLDF